MRTPSRAGALCFASAVIAVSALVVQISAAQPPSSASGHGERARWVAGRLIAPCCWTQTLDIHDSEISAILRLEIADRLAHGETSSAIEADLARRYGERIRAVPADADPRVYIVMAVALAMLASVYVLVRKARSGARAQRVDVALLPENRAETDAYDAALDAELLRVEKYT